MNISTWIERNAQFSPNKIAIYFEGQTISYRELSDQIETAARMLSGTLNVGHGDRVSLLATNIPEYLVALFACAKIGAILNPLNWRLAIPELAYIVQNAESSVLLIEQEYADFSAHVNSKMPSIHQVGFDFKPDSGHTWSELMANAPAEPPTSAGSISDTIQLVYTSGTTGHPKGAMLSQNALLWNAVQSQHMHSMTKDDVILTCLPLFHVGGLNNQTTPALHAGASVVLQRRFVPDDVLSAISAADGVHPAPTICCLVPATQAAVIGSPRWQATGFSQLRIVCTGSMLVPRHLSDEFRKVGVIVVEMYGCTETTPIAVYHRGDSDFDRVGSTGLPGLHCEVKIIDANGNQLPAGEEGEILLRGPNIMQGYWRNPKATASALEDGWFRTGDIGRQDEDGYVYIKDRKKNMIISGGENIYAAEVERVLVEHPAVAECALIGMPDKKWGERPEMVVVPDNTNSEGLDEAVLKIFMQDKIARFKQPRVYHFVNELPKNALGKVQHFKLRQDFANGG
ncbi:MAG: long-chain-fatty-acid--CoA ligase [Chloroflexota bacterium]